MKLVETLDALGLPLSDSLGGVDDLYEILFGFQEKTNGHST
jgi:hypothetical protein